MNVKKTKITEEIRLRAGWEEERMIKISKSTKGEKESAS